MMVRERQASVRTSGARAVASHCARRRVSERNRRRAAALSAEMSARIHGLRPCIRAPFLPEIRSCPWLSAAFRSLWHAYIVTHFTGEHIHFRRSCNCRGTWVSPHGHTKNFRLFPYIQEVGNRPLNGQISTLVEIGP